MSLVINLFSPTLRSFYFKFLKNKLFYYVIDRMSFPCPGDVIRIGSWTRSSFFYPFVSQKVFPLKSKYFQVFIFLHLFFLFLFESEDIFRINWKVTWKNVGLICFVILGQGVKILIQRKSYWLFSWWLEYHLLIESL